MVVVGAAVRPLVVEQGTFRFAALRLEDVEITPGIKVVPWKIKKVRVGAKCLRGSQSTSSTAW